MMPPRPACRMTPGAPLRSSQVLALKMAGEAIVLRLLRRGPDRPRVTRLGLARRPLLLRSAVMRCRSRRGRVCSVPGRGMGGAGGVRMGNTGGAGGRTGVGAGMDGMPYAAGGRMRRPADMRRPANTADVAEMARRRMRNPRRVKGTDAAAEVNAAGVAAAEAHPAEMDPAGARTTKMSAAKMASAKARCTAAEMHRPTTDMTAAKMGPAGAHPRRRRRMAATAAATGDSSRRGAYGSRQCRRSQQDECCQRNCPEWNGGPGHGGFLKQVKLPHLLNATAALRFHRRPKC